MDLGLRGRTAVVGGSSRGLGAAIAERLAAEGCDLLLWSRDPDRLDAHARHVEGAHGVRVATVVADATDPTAAETVTTAAFDVFGSVDVCVLNAGGPPVVDATATDPDEWRRSFQLLCVTPVEIATRLLPGMRQRGWGRIVAVLSSGVRQPIEHLVYSNACRSALVAWLKTIAAEVASDGVTVNGVLPGRIATDRVAELDALQAAAAGISPDEARARSEATIPIGRYGRPDEFAAAVAYLCSHSASYQTGTFVAVDGGLIRSLP